MPPANAAAMSSIPLWYRLFFLYIEPVATAVGALAAVASERASREAGRL